MVKTAGRAARFTAVLLIAWASAAPSIVQAQETQHRWGFGTDLGFTSGTVNGTVFTLGFNADYYVDRAFSVGPMLLLSPLGDLTQIAIAGVARYHVRTGALNLVPFAGFGLVHADLDRGNGPGRIDRNDTSWYVPIGISAEYPVNPKLAFASTLIVNLHDINLQPSLWAVKTACAPSHEPAHPFRPTSTDSIHPFSWHGVLFFPG